MTAQPEVPGAPAVYLFREETTDDALHLWTKYVRLKVLTEKGKEYANVELRQYSVSGGGGYTVNDVQGRTIHPDGTIIPFTGKPQEKLLEKGQGFTEKAKVFTLPDVEVGSIVEYRYTLRYDDNYFTAPDWFVQTDLYTCKGHYLWRPTDKELLSKSERGEQITSTVAWDAILPKPFAVSEHRLPPTSQFQNGQDILELNVHDIMPVPQEEFMPPIESLSYRVLFYYTAYRTSDEYWKNEGKGWARNQDKFIGPGSKVQAATKDVIAGSGTEDDKLQKIYAAVMKLDNTNFGRSRSAAEDKSQGLAPARTTDDIWERKRGSDDQIAALFVAMARAAGMKAYLMAIVNRDRAVFMPAYLSFNQFNDFVAIVTVDGKQRFFDPGQRDTPYGHLAWKHTQANGLRQVEGGSALGATPGEPLTYSHTSRVANLTMDAAGGVTGTVKLTWTGDPALRWRQIWLRGDDTSVSRNLRTAVERMLPRGMDVKVDTIEHLDEYEQPLVLTCNVKGRIGSSTGKRLLLPTDLFLSNATPTFPHEKREIPVYFQYPYVTQDAVRITFPESLKIEALPAAEHLAFQKFAAYALTTTSTPTSITVRREMDLGNILYLSTEYADLRAFYSKLETKDQESTVLKADTAPAGN